MTIVKSILHELLTLLTTAKDQITSNTPAAYHQRSTRKDLSFTKGFYKRAAWHSLTEADAKDVYYSGIASKYKTKWLQDKMYKNYNGYRLTISYFKDSRTGKPVISAIWKTEKE